MFARFTRKQSYRRNPFSACEITVKQRVELNHQTKKRYRFSQTMPNPCISFSIQNVLYNKIKTNLQKQIRETTSQMLQTYQRLFGQNNFLIVFLLFSSALPQAYTLNAHQNPLGPRLYSHRVFNDNALFFTFALYQQSILKRSYALGKVWNPIHGTSPIPGLGSRAARNLCTCSAIGEYPQVHLRCRPPCSQEENSRSV